MRIKDLSQCRCDSIGRSVNNLCWCARTVLTDTIQTPARSREKGDGEGEGERKGKGKGRGMG